MLKNQDLFDDEDEREKMRRWKNAIKYNPGQKIDKKLNFSYYYKTLTPKAPKIIGNPSTVITIQPHFHHIITT